MFSISLGNNLQISFLLFTKLILQRADWRGCCWSSSIFYHKSTVPIAGKQQGICLVGENVLSPFVQGWQRTTIVLSPLDHKEASNCYPAQLVLKCTYIYINKIDPLERDKRVVVQSSSNFFLPVFSSAFCRLFARLIHKINPKGSGKVRTHSAIFITSDNIFGICRDVHLAPPPLMRPHYFMVGASCSLAQRLSEECVNRNDHRRLGLMPESVALYCAVHPTFIMPFVITLTAVNTGESFYVWDRCGRFARLINHGRSPFMKQSHFIHKG